MKIWIALLLVIPVYGQANEPGSVQIKELVVNAESQASIRLVHDEDQGEYNFEICKMMDPATGETQCNPMLVHGIKDSDFPLFYKLFQKNLSRLLEPHLSLTGTMQTMNSVMSVVYLGANVMWTIQSFQHWQLQRNFWNGFNAFSGGIFSLLSGYLTTRELWSLWRKSPDYNRLYSRFVLQSSEFEEADQVNHDVWVIFVQSLLESLRDAIEARQMPRQL